MKKLIALFMAAAIPLLSACSGLTILSNYREIEDLELVRTICADMAEDGYNLTTCALPSGQGGSAQLYEKVSSSVGLSLSKIETAPTGKETILSHTENILMSEDFAKDGVQGLLDYVERSVGIRFDTDIMIVKGSAAKDFVKGISGKEIFPTDILTEFSDNVKKTGRGAVFTCRETAIALATNGTALIMAVEGAKADKLFEDRGELDLIPVGFGVIKDGKLVDYLTLEETRGALLFLSKFEAEDIDITCENSVLTLVIEGAKTDITPEFSKDGALTGFSVKIEAEANILNIKGEGRIEEEDFRKKVEAELSKVLKASVDAAVKRSQDMNTDFLNFESVVEKKEPIKFKNLPTSVPESLSELTVTVDCRSILRRTYDLNDPMGVSGEEAEEPWDRLTKSLSGS